MSPLRLSPFRLLCLLVSLKALLVTALLLWGGIGLGPDEAQYWTWSRHLDWGYYSKPPGIAWQIALGTVAFGHQELGVRALSVAIGAVLPLTLFGLARGAGLTPKEALWSGLVFLLAPVGWLGSLLAITDGGMLLFWTLAAWTYLAGRHYLLIGALIGLGALFKWPIYLLWVAVLWRRGEWLQKGGGLVLSLLGLLPTVWWNAHHDWPTFRHVFSTVKGGAIEQGTTLALFRGNFWDFVGAQASLLTPLFFLVWIAATMALYRHRRTLPRGYLWCGGVTLAIFVAFGGVALVQKVKGNWAIFAYPTAAVVIGGFLAHTRAWLRWGSVVTSGALVAGAFTLPVLQGKGWLPFKNNPFKHNLGWKELSPLIAHQDIAEGDFLFADTYQLASILSFYSPEQQPAYFFNLRGTRNNQFSYWPGMAEQEVGKNGLFCVVESAPHLEEQLEGQREVFREKLQPYFRKVTDRGVHLLCTSRGKMCKGILLFYCEEYNGKTPDATGKY